MHDETVETYTNIYARWFAIISRFIVTASLCTLWRLQMTRYSQVLVHSTVVNSRLSHQYMSISPFLWGFTAGFLELFLEFLQFQLLFARSFPAFLMVEAQHHKLTTTYWKKPLVSFNIKNTVIRNGNLYEPGPPAYTYVNLPLPCVHAGAFLRFMSIISYRILVAKRSDS